MIIPAAAGSRLSEELGEQGIERLKQWVRDGGTLVTIGASTQFAREQLELIELRDWYETYETDEGEEAQHFGVPGVIFRATLGEYWMAAGYEGGELPVLVDSDRLLLPAEGPPSTQRRVVASIATGERARISGHAWPETLERIGGAVFAYEERVGRGRVIAFAEDVNYRAYFRGANRLFLNAVILGPSAP